MSRRARGRRRRGGAMRALLWLAVLLLAGACLVGLVNCPSPSTSSHTPTERPARPIGNRRYSVEAFDVGTGLSVLIRGGDFALLYDGGSNDDLADERDNRLLAYLEDSVGPSSEASCRPSASEGSQPVRERTIDHMVLSHPHRDHVSLLPDVLRCYDVDHVWDSGLPSSTNIYERFERAVFDEPGAVLHQAAFEGSAPRWPGAKPFSVGTRLELGEGARMTVLSVNPAAKDANDASIVLRLDLGGASVLLPGDATAGERNDPSDEPSPRSVEGRLLASDERLLDVDILVVGHHGSSTSSRASFLRAVSPRYAVVSSGPVAYGRVVLPDQNVLDALAQSGARILRTDRDDGACKVSPSKVGRDADGEPGGCSAVRLVIDERGTIAEE
jgi:competence protein ComEC